MNQFIKKQDFEDGLYQIIQPLKDFYKEESPGRLDLGTSGTVYSKSTRDVEGFLRVLWGVAPLLTYKTDDFFTKKYLDGIIAGTDPDNSNYWGTPTDFDQLLVEMAALSTGLLLDKDKFWDVLTKEQQENLSTWLYTINEKKVHKNNWYFFRVLVNVALKHCGCKWDEATMKDDLNVIDSFYIGNGWYCDGVSTQMDYYISFAIHYYSLIYYKHMKQDDPENCKKIKDRAIQFANDFQHWFDDNGEALPFGRSLTYRFAQSAFWSALVYADIEALPWGTIKGILSRNIKRWYSHNIFSTDGILTIGYHYANLNMAEGYNGPGSPYWALKTFLILAVSETHDFWQAPIIEKPINEEMILLPEARMLITSSAGQTQAFVAGQLTWQQSHVDGKYSKLVYSTKFGVSISKSSLFYCQGGFDNCLAVSEEENLYYRSKLYTTNYEVLEDQVMNQWNPWYDVEITSRVFPLNSEWHIRVHDIFTKRELYSVDGGFSIPFTNESKEIKIEDGIAYNTPIGTTVIIPILGYKESDFVIPEANTNLFFERSAYPALFSKKLSTGKHRLISLVGGCQETHLEESSIPKVSYDNNIISVKLGDIDKKITLALE